MLRFLRCIVYTLCLGFCLQHASAAEFDVVDEKINLRIREALLGKSQISELKYCLVGASVPDIKIVKISEFLGNELFSVRCDAMYRDFPVLIRENRAYQVIMPILNERGRIETSEFCSAISKSASNREFFCTTCSDIAPFCVQMLFKIWKQHSGVSVERLSVELISKTELYRKAK